MISVEVGARVSERSAPDRLLKGRPPGVRRRAPALGGPGGGAGEAASGRLRSAFGAAPTSGVAEAKAGCRCWCRAGTQRGRGSDQMPG